MRPHQVFQCFYPAAPISQSFAHQGAENILHISFYLFLKHFSFWRTTPLAARFRQGKVFSPDFSTTTQ
jgi:hypothetical protein